MTVRRTVTSSHRFFNNSSQNAGLYELSNLGQVVAYSAGHHLFRQNTSADCIFEIKSGLVLTYNITTTGNRRIIDFYTPGQSIGIAVRGVHRLSCQAITPAEVAVMSRGAILDMTDSNTGVVKRLWSEIISERVRHEQHIVWLGSPAKERVAGFLITMAERCDEGGMVELPITRRELSEYLGLTVETVSRVVTAFRASGAIAFDNDPNRIKILDRRSLETDAGWV